MGSNAYAGIQDAKVQTKYPFCEIPGIHIVRPLNWACRETRLNGPGDFFDYEVVKSNNPDMLPGTKYSRMRLLRRDGSLSEIKQRALACFGALGHPLDASQITPDVLGDITDKAGSMFTDTYLRIEATTTKTKDGKPFTAFVYAVPSAADLDGLR